MILLMALLSDHLAMPGEYLRDTSVATLLLDEDIEVFYDKKQKRVRFQGLTAGDLLLEESVWESERRGLGQEYLGLSLSEIDSVWVYLPLHDIKDLGPIHGTLVMGGCAALGVPVGMATMLGLLYIYIETRDFYGDIGTAIALAYLTLYSGTCLGAAGGCVTGAYIYDKRISRPASGAKTQMLLDRVMELRGQGNE
ncbi:MAG: hypothetical protein ACP5QG_07410 [candidate division WOR-3 bacterium]